MSQLRFFPKKCSRALTQVLALLFLTKGANAADILLGNYTLVDLHSFASSNSSAYPSILNSIDPGSTIMDWSDFTPATGYTATGTTMVSYGNLGSAVPFNLARVNSSTDAIAALFLAGRSSPSSSSSYTIPFATPLIGQKSFYALMNTYWGATTDLFHITINFSDGTTQAYQAIGGSNVRDFNYNPTTPQTIFATTTNWQYNPGPVVGGQWLDIRSFAIDPSNYARNIASITLTGVDMASAAGFMAGLSVSTQAVIPFWDITESYNTTYNTGSGVNRQYLNNFSNVMMDVSSKFDGGTLSNNASGASLLGYTVTTRGGYINAAGHTLTFAGAFANDSIGSQAGRIRIQNLDNTTLDYTAHTASSGASSAGTVSLTGNNSNFDGGFTVEAGANLQISTANALGSGTLELVGTPTVSATLSTTANMTISNAITVAYDPTFNVAPGTTTTVTSVIADGVAPGDIVVTGGGTLELTNANTYSGPTTINSGSTLKLSGNGSITSTASVQNDGTFNIQSKTTNVSLSGTYAQSSSGLLSMGFTALSNPQLLVSGTASLAGSLLLTATPGSYSAGRYTLINATQGVSGIFTSFSTNFGSYTNNAYALSYDANNVYLTLTYTGPTASDTLASMTRNAYSLRGAYSLQSAIINTGLTYDCTTFDARGICLSAGGRVTDTNNPATNAQGALLIASYRVNDYWRIGAYLDQNLSSKDHGGVDLENNNPMGGVFAVWDENMGGTGYQVRLAAGYSDKDITIRRSVFGTAEAGKGDSSLQSQAYSAMLSRGFQMNDSRWITSPYLGLRYTKIKRAGYAEEHSSDVLMPLTYSALSQETTTVLAGIRFNARFSDKINVMASVGVEDDIAHNTSDYAATGVAGLTPIAFNQNIRHVRPVASAGLNYAIDKRQTISANLNFRSEVFNSTNSLTGMVNYQIGF